MTNTCRESNIRGIFDNIREKLLSYFNAKDKLNSEFIQYHHEVGECVYPCFKCLNNDLRIFANDGTQPPIGEDNHPNCHCFYTEVETKTVGLISKMGELAPDVYLKKYGCLPDYYITKEEARSLGWTEGKNLAHFAPGKMIGGDIFYNNKHILPEKEGRIWYECDVDYEGLKRNKKRLYYSNDGLIFYSDEHNESKVVQII